MILDKKLMKTGIRELKKYLIIRQTLTMYYDERLANLKQTNKTLQETNN